MRNYLRWNYVVFACLWLVVGCTKTHVIYVTPSPALTQVVKAGDTIKWRATEFGEPDFFVHFLDGNNPCVMPDRKVMYLKSVNGVAECTLDKSIDLQQFKYAIDHIDPTKSNGVVTPKPCGGCTVTPTVGPKSCGPCAKVEKGLGTPVVVDGDPDGAIKMTCNPNANPAITATPPANPVDTIYWTPKNVPDPNMDGWKVTYPYVPGQTPASLCTNNLTQFDSNHTSCEFASGQLPPQLIFSVTTGSCTTPQTVTINLSPK